MKKIFTLLILVAVLASCSAPVEEVELVLDTKSDLGEGAIWNHKTQRLYWVNITKKIFNVYNPALHINKELRTGQMIGTVVPSESGMVIVALQNGIYHLDVETGTKKFIVDPEADITDNRFNDGKCDPAGRFWAGTMNVDGENGKGSLYRIDGDGTAAKMISPVSISNGIVWSLDGEKMYYIDTPTQQVVSYDFDGSTGEIDNRKVIIEVPKESGSPDGMTIDSDGNLWIALWGGFAVGCWNPGTGELIRKIEVPAKNVTSCAFGGENLETLYITTARMEMTKEELDLYPLSGGLFKTTPGFKGVEAAFFKGDF